MDLPVVWRGAEEVQLLRSEPVNHGEPHCTFCGFHDNVTPSDIHEMLERDDAG